ncbi:MAG: hypothetical protein EBU46_00235 [Nitrosomonadaceae bacterium]|nr:hypothetical protein [Nitrosomonadaceae bacterium]
MTLRFTRFKKKLPPIGVQLLVTTTTGRLYYGDFDGVARLRDWNATGAQRGRLLKSKGYNLSLHSINHPVGSGGSTRIGVLDPKELLLESWAVIPEDIRSIL